MFEVFASVKQTWMDGWIDTCKSYARKQKWVFF